jgi:hypothetical protein
MKVETKQPRIILVVDDDDANRYVVSRILRQANYQVKEAATGTAAIELAAEQPDLIILDIKLPDIDGFEVCRQLKADLATSLIPILHLSARRVTSQDKIQGLDSGADGYLTHPVNPLELIANVKALLRIRQIERQLQESEQKFRAIFEQTFQYIGLLDIDGIVIEANQTSLEFGGLRSEDVVRRPFWETRWWTQRSRKSEGRRQKSGVGSRESELSPKQEQLRQAIAKAAKGEFVRYEVDVLGAEDRVATIDFSLKPVKDEEGNVVLLIPEGRDISDRKRAEEELRRREQHFRTLAENSPDIVARFDRDFRHLYISPAIERATGIPPERFLGKTKAEIGLGSEFCALWDEQLQQVFDTGQPCFFAFDFPTPTGIHFYHAFVVPEFASDGTVESVLGISRDITDYKQQEQALQKSERRLRRLVDANIIGIVFADSERIIEANDAFLEMVGYSREALETGEITWRKMTPPEYLKRDEQGIEELLARGACTPFEKEYIRKDGSRVPILIGAALIDRQPLQWVCYILDLTQIKQLENQLRQQTKQLERTNRIKDEFLATLSHELRTPLNSILGWSQLLRSSKFDPETTVRALEVIERNAKLQTQLIEDLLDISRIIRGKLKLNINPLDLTIPIKAAIETVHVAAAGKSIEIKTSLDSGIGKVSGDPDRLQQVVWNLLTNAIKFTPAGGKIEVRLERVGDQARIQVSDTGQGIAPDFLPHMFEYFRQADSSITRTQAGLGLGLAIARHLVELHGGTVSAESKGEGKGSTFTVMLPLRKSRAEANEESQSFASYSNLKGTRVLVVDDDRDTREFLTLMLEQYEAVVKAVSSAREALEALEPFQPDVLVSDIGMPGEDGYTLLRHIRERGGDIPAIALTAYAREEDSQQALSAGFQMHLSKPVEVNKLINAIADLISK